MRMEQEFDCPIAGTDIALVMEGVEEYGTALDAPPTRRYPRLNALAATLAQSYNSPGRNKQSCDSQLWVAG